MGRFRGGRGGSRGHRGGRGGRGRGNFHGNNGGDKYCNNCGNNKSHTTKECNKGGNHHNQNNRVDKHNRNKKNSHGDSKNHKTNNNQDPCIRCGLKGHNRKNCNAKELPEEQQCECGCEFHRSNQCPWDNDPLERDAADSQATGMICQWCKDAGDGMHVYEDCKEPKLFRVQLLKNIQRAYDDIKWCWHCSSTNHATRACTATSAEQGKVKWNAAVSSIISMWLGQDLSVYEARYRDNDEDVTMITAMNQQRPPMPADFKWCLVCEEFGHIVNNSSKDCNHAEYERRCPPQFRGMAITAKQPFVPAGFTNTSISTADRGFGTAPVNTTTFFHECANPGCHAKLGPWHIPAPRLGESIICRKCNLINSNPSSSRRDSKIELLKIVSQILEKKGGSDANHYGKKCKKSILDAIKNPYLKRPSMALSKKLAVHQWPARQPQYTDLTTQLGKEQVFKDNGSYFNEPGNHQTYFPAAKFRIREDMIEIANNDDLFINKAGRLGLRLFCLTCGMPALVADEEGDLVMCGTDGMCTVGCGRGFPFWCDENGAPKQSCRCLPVIGQVPNVAWITPPR